jgi:hypothetical protein
VDVEQLRQLSQCSIALAVDSETRSRIHPEFHGSPGGRESFEHSFCIPAVLPGGLSSRTWRSDRRRPIAAETGHDARLDNGSEGPLAEGCALCIPFRSKAAPRSRDAAPEQPCVPADGLPALFFGSAFLAHRHLCFKTRWAANCA